jgi:HEAT repeat protein
MRVYICYSDCMIRWILGAAVLALGGTAAGAPPTPATLTPTPDGALELRAGKAAARIPLRTPALRRGNPTLREHDIDGHRVAEVRVPVRGTSAEEVWVGELGKNGPRAIWEGVAGPRDADNETAIWLEVTDDGILEYQTAAQVTRCDGTPPRLFPRAYDFDAGRMRPVVSPVPPPPEQKLVGRRGDPAMPAPPARPIGDFRWTAASTTATAGSDARALSPPAGLEDADLATAWKEGLGGDGRGEFLTARSSGHYAIRGLRILPGDGASEQAYRAGNRVTRLELALGPGPDQRFDVELPDDVSRWRQPFWVALPKPMVSSCVTVVVTEVAHGSEAAPPRNQGTTAISDLAIFTDLDGPEGAERLVSDLAKAADCTARVPLVLGLGAAAVLPAAQAVMATKGPARECLVEALTALEPEPRNPIVAEALVAAIPGATPKEERLVTAALKRASAPPVAGLTQLLDAAQVPVEDRVRAARILGALGDERAPAALLASAGHGPAPVRAAVVDALVASAALQPEALLAALGQAQAEGAARQADLVRVLPAAVKRTPARRPDALAALRAALGEDRAFEVRGRAVMALGQLDDGGAGGEGVAALASLRAGSDDPVLRYLAARELAGANGQAAAAALRLALADRDPRVRETAALGLGQQRDGSAGAVLIQAAKEEPWPFVRRAELEALGRLCVPGTGDLMMRAGQRDVDEVRRAALVTLVRCKDPRSRPVLLRAVGRRNESATVRELAAALLGELGDRGAAPALAAALGRLVNESEADLALEGVAVAALRALARLGGPQAVTAAVTLARDAKHPFRPTAVEALGTLCDPGAGAEALRALEQGSDPSLAAAAETAARRCGAHARP